MRINTNAILALIAATAAGTLAFFASANADDNDGLDLTPAFTAEAVFAGGCFWCVESDFDKVEGVVETVSGYTGGSLNNPTYKQVSNEDTGHYEAVKIVYNPEKVTYSELVEYFWRHVDPTDDGGQFCDRGFSYKTAIFVGSDEERNIATTSKSTIDESGVLDAPIVTPILGAATFWPAEGYHQDYYEKNPLRYNYYRQACGRDKTVKKVWAKEKASN